MMILCVCTTKITDYKYMTLEQNIPKKTITVALDNLHPTNSTNELKPLLEVKE